MKKRLTYNNGLKKGVGLVVLLMMSMLMLPTVAMAEDFSEDGLYYSTLTSYTVQVVKPTSGSYSGAIIIPETVTHNGEKYKVTAIGKNAFQAAFDVTSVTLPLTTITSIGSYAFNDCRGLTEFTLPASITEIGEKAFYYCDNLHDLYVHSTNPASYNPGSEAFSKIHYGSHVCTLHVPTGCKDAYKTDPTFNVFTQVEEFDPPQLYDLYITGTRVTELNASDILGDGAASYDADKKTLTISKDITTDVDNQACIGSLESNLIINIAAPVTLSALNEPIYLWGSTTITGSSLLTLNSSYITHSISISNADLSIVNANIVADASISGYNNVLSVTNSSVTIDCTSPAITGFSELTLTDCYLRTPLGGTYGKCSTWNNHYCVMDQDENAAEYVEIVPTKVPHGLGFNVTETTVKMDEAYTLPTLTNPNNLAVTWESSNEKVATVNASTGAVTLVAPGNTTITALFAGNDFYLAGSANYILTVLAAKGDVNHDGQVNQTDVDLTAQHILGKKPAGFYEDAADMNGDKKINAADIVLINKEIKP